MLTNSKGFRNARGVQQLEMLRELCLNSLSSTQELDSFKNWVSQRPLNKKSDIILTDDLRQVSIKMGESDFEKLMWTIEIQKELSNIMSRFVIDIFDYKIKNHYRSDLEQSKEKIKQLINKL